MDESTLALLRSVPKHRGPIVDTVAAAAQRYNVPPALLLRAFRQESNFNSASVSNAGAIGVAQLMPGTAKQLGVDPFDTTQNIDGGARYMAQMLAKFGDHKLALAAYNAGPDRVAKYLAGRGSLPAETVNYVHAITDGGRWNPAPAAGAARPVRTEAVRAEPDQTPPGLLQIPGM